MNDFSPAAVEGAIDPLLVAVITEPNCWWNGRGRRHVRGGHLNGGREG